MACTGEGTCGEVSWPCGQPGHRKVVPALGQVVAVYCALNYVPGTKKEQLTNLGIRAEKLLAENNYESPGGSQEPPGWGWQE